MMCPLLPLHSRQEASKGWLGGGGEIQLCGWVIPGLSCWCWATVTLQGPWSLEFYKVGTGAHRNELMFRIYHQAGFAQPPVRA